MSNDHESTSERWSSESVPKADAIAHHIQRMVDYFGSRDTTVAARAPELIRLALGYDEATIGLAASLAIKSMKNLPFVIEFEELIERAQRGRQRSEERPTPELPPLSYIDEARLIIGWLTDRKPLFNDWPELQPPGWKDLPVRDRPSAPTSEQIEEWVMRKASSNAIAYVIQHVCDARGRAPQKIQTGPMDYDVVKAIKLHLSTYADMAQFDYRMSRVEKRAEQIRAAMRAGEAA